MNEWIPHAAWTNSLITSRPRREEFCFSKLFPFFLYILSWLNIFLPLTAWLYLAADPRDTSSHFLVFYTCFMLHRLPQYLSTSRSTHPRPALDDGQGDLEFLILLLPLPQCGDPRSVTPHPADAALGDQPGVLYMWDKLSSSWTTRPSTPDPWQGFAL